MRAVTTDIQKPRLRNVFHKWFWDTWDNLGKVILGNIIWFIFSLPTIIVIFGFLFPKEGPTLLGALSLLLMIPTLFLSAPMTAALFHLTYFFVQEREASYRELFIGFKKYFKKSVIIGFILTLITILLLVDIQFYSNYIPIKFIGPLLSALGIWGFLFVYLMQVYLFPVMVQVGGSVRQILKKSALLVLDNAGYTLVVGGVGALVVVGLAIIPRGIVFALTLWTVMTMSLISILFNNAFAEILKKYKKKEVEKEKEPGKPTSWKEIRKEEEVEERPRRRGWRDIFRPWDM